MFLRGIVTSSFLVLASCADGKDDTGLSKKEEDTLISFHCSLYAYSICRVVANECQDELEATLGDDETGYYDWNNRCYVDVMDWCEPTLAALPDLDDAIFIAKGVCIQGYSEDRLDSYAALGCSDVTYGEYYREDWPFLDLCPCFDTGDYYYSEYYDTYVCGTQPGKESLLTTVYHAVTQSH